MSLDKVAQHLAAQGRGNDSVLVHMSPKEVGALQHMAKQHGGSLSINPQTGLPEAGFLDAILPVVAGAGLSLIPGIGPLMAAGIVGGGTALLTKDLNKGLMAGLGAFGGAGLAGGIMSTGAASLADAAIPAGTEVAGQTANGVGAGAWSSDASLAANSAQQTAAGYQPAEGAISGTAKNVTGITDPSAWDKLQAGFKNTTFDTDFLKKNMLPIGAALAPALMGGGNLFGGNPAQQQQTANAGYIRPYTYSQVRNPNYTGAGTPYFTQTMTPGTPIASGDYGSQLMPLAAEGGIMDTRKMAAGGIADAPGIVDTTKYAGIPAYAADNSMFAQPVVPVYDPVTKQYVTPTAPVAPAPVAPVTPAPLPDAASNQGYSSYIPNATNVDGGGGVGSGEANGGLMQSYAMGGGIGSYYPSPDDGQGGQHPQDTMMGAHPSVSMGPAYPMQGIKSSYATGGGIYNLGGYSDGGRLLKGPGDGVSDDIPAQIGAKQPARLADGEFVVPARIVSELGNGSTDAGAKRLYAMMERVQSGRKKSVGKDKVAVDSKSYKHLPA